MTLINGVTIAFLNSSGTTPSDNEQVTSLVIEPGDRGLMRLPEPRASRKTVLKVKCFSEASFKGSKGAFVSWCRTRESFQEGMPLLPLGLSLWKLSRRQVRFSSLLTLMGELPNLSAMAICSHQWYPAATSCPETSTEGSQLWLSEVVPWSPPDYWGTTL